MLETDKAGSKIAGNEYCNIISNSENCSITTIVSAPQRKLKDYLIYLSVCSYNQTTYQYSVRIDEELVFLDKYISLDKSIKLKEISKSFKDLFGSNNNKDDLSKKQEQIAQDLFDIWLASSWKEISKKMEQISHFTLVISSDISEVLNLPWELLRPPDNEFLGIDPGFSILRLPRNGALEKFRGHLPSENLKILFMPCLPMDNKSLDYNLEDNAVADIMNKLGQVAVENGEYGTFDEFSDLIEGFKPHIVHLIGYGIREKDEIFFAFEDEYGRSDLRSPIEIQKILIANNVKFIFINLYQDEKYSSIGILDKICQDIICKDVPLAVGWPGPLSKDHAAEFAAIFYRNVAQKNTIDGALFEARKYVWNLCNKNENLKPLWAMPIFYSYTDQNSILEPDPIKSIKQSYALKSNRQMALKKKRGNSEIYIVRRSEHRRLLPGLKDGSIKAIVITGIDGCGKSTLLSALTTKLKRTSNEIIEVNLRSSREKPLDLENILKQFSITLLNQSIGTYNEIDRLQFKNASKIMIDDQWPPRTRLESFVTKMMEEYSFLITIDNFENNINEKNLKINDPDIAEFYDYMINRKSGESRAIIISSVMPSCEPLPIETFRWESLADFDEVSTIRILENGTSNFPPALLHNLYRTFGGNPEFLFKMRDYLDNKEFDCIKRELDSLRLFMPNYNSTRSNSVDPSFEKNPKLNSQICCKNYARLNRKPVNVPPSQSPNDTYYKKSIASIPDKSTTYLSVEEIRKFEKKIPYSNIDMDISRNEQELDIVEPEFPVDSGNLGKNYLLFLKKSSVRFSFMGLSARSQRALCKTAVFCVPVEIEGLISVSNETAKSLTKFILEWKARSFVISENRGKREFFKINGILRMWLMAQLSPEECRAAHKAAGDFLIKQKGYDYIGLHHSDYLHEAVIQYKESDDNEIARTITKKIGKLSVEFKNLQLFEDIYQLTNDYLYLNKIAKIYLDLNDTTNARAWFEKTCSADHKIKPQIKANAFHGLAKCDYHQGNYVGAWNNINKALELAEDFNDNDLQARIMHFKGVIANGQCHYDDALIILNQVIEKRSKDKVKNASTWHLIGEVYQNQGDYEKARNNFNKALEIREKFDRKARHLTIRNLARLDIEEGRYEEARLRLNTFLEKTQQGNDIAGEASALYDLAELDQVLGRYLHAREKFQSSLEYNKKIENRKDEAACLVRLSMMDRDEGKLDDARIKLNRVLNINLLIDNKKDEAKHWQSLGQIDLEERKLREAREKFEKSRYVNQEIGNKQGEADSLVRLADACLEENRYEEAYEYLKKAQEIYKEIGKLNSFVTLQNRLATIQLVMSKFNQAREDFNIYSKLKENSYGTVFCVYDENDGELTGLREELNAAQLNDNYIQQARLHIKIAKIEIEKGRFNDARRSIINSMEINTSKSNYQGGKASSWYHLAFIDMKEKEYDAASEKFQEQLRLNQEIENDEDEAAAWYWLSRVDLRKEKYIAARKKIQKSLEINKKINNLERVVDALIELSQLAWKADKQMEAYRLKAIGYQIASQFGFKDAEGLKRDLEFIASRLNHSPEQFNEALLSAKDAYEHDTYLKYIEEAFR